MVPFLSLLFVVGLAPEGELKHAEPFAITLSADDAPLEGYGPSKTFRYEPEGNDTPIIVHATSSDVALVLDIEIDRGKEGKPNPRAFDGGTEFSTNPIATAQIYERVELIVRVAAKEAGATGSAMLYVFEARESKATRAAAKAADANFAEARRRSHAATRPAMPSRSSPRSIGISTSRPTAGSRPNPLRRSGTTIPSIGSSASGETRACAIR